MFEATATRASQGSYQVTRDGSQVATMEFQGSAEAGAVIDAQDRLTIRREQRTSGLWLLERDDGADPHVVASAEKPSAMRSRLILRAPDRPELQLDRPSAWKPVFKLTEADRAVGTIRRVRGLRRPLQADIHDDVPATLQLFALWMVLLLERRAANTRAAARKAR